MKLNRLELKMFTSICLAVASALFIINGVLYARRGDGSEASTQIGLGLMFLPIGIALYLASD